MNLAQLNLYGNPCNRILFQKRKLLLQAAYARSVQKSQAQIRPGESAARASSIQCFSNTARSCAAKAEYTYRIAAAHCGKDRAFDRARDTYVFRPNVQPSSRQESQGHFNPARNDRVNIGEDAFFVGQVGTTTDVAFGVADGVGGWRDSGVNPRHFSRGLCHYMEEGASSFPSWSQTPNLGPLELLRRGYDRVFENHDIAAGGSTALVAVAQSEGRILVANLGDSGFLHLRPVRIRHFSKPQTHAFNTPYQLTVLPARQGVRERLPQGFIVDAPEDATTSSHEVAHGDVFVFATDGAWDNLSPQHVLRACAGAMTNLDAWHDRDGSFQASNELAGLTDPHRTGDAESKQPALQVALAQEIISQAKAASEDMGRESPFSKSMSQEYGRPYRGGKVDDMSAIVVVVVKNQD